MYQTFSENDLRSWFCKNADERLLDYVDEFVREMGESRFAQQSSDRSIPSSNRIDDEFEDREGVAQLLLETGGGKYAYICIEPIILQFMKSLLSHAIIASAFGQNPALDAVSMIELVISLGEKAAESIKELDAEEFDFCHYLLENHYTYCDRLRSIIFADKRSFSMTDVINDYCCWKQECAMIDDIDALHQSVGRAVEALQKKDILVPDSDNMYYINF